MRRVIVNEEGLVETLSSQARIQRRAMGLTLDELSEITGVGKQSLSQFEHGKLYLRGFVKTVRIAAALNIPLFGVSEFVEVVGQEPKAEALGLE